MDQSASQEELKESASSRTSPTFTPGREHRASYIKTTAFALLLILCLQGLAALAWGAAPGLWRATLVILLGIAALMAGLVFCSGLVVLRRDTMERRGLPDLYYRYFSRDPTGRYSGRRHFLRPLLGRSPRPGDVVRLRSPKEILATLDDSGCCDGLPFMPEMLSWFGEECVVDRRIDKINDWMGGNVRRRTERVVTLVRVRCSGEHHGGCQAGCQILWRDCWLSRRSAKDTAGLPSAATVASGLDQLAALARAVAARPVAGSGHAKMRYACQITALLNASKPMSPRDIRQDIRPLFNGNLSLAGFLVATLTALFRTVQGLRGGAEFPWAAAMLERGPTPTAALDLQPGDWVEVRTKVEIGLTLYKAHNRGMWFGQETVRFCKQRYRVRSRVEQIIHERTGELLRLKTPGVILEGVCGSGEFLRLCPQNEYVFWREIWLKRVAMLAEPLQ